MIGYYAHHVGAGHVTRAAQLAHELDEPVTLLTSRAGVDPGPFAAVVRLDRDDDVVPGPASEADAHGALHHAPLDSPGYRRRSLTVAGWVAATSPRAVVVDVSTEVAVLVRALGVPVVVVAQPGDRTDDAHELARRVASAVVAPWPAHAYRPAWLEPHLARTTFTGALSRHVGRVPGPRPVRGTVLVLSGGDVGWPATVDEARAATPGWTWTTAGLTGDDWLADPWPALCAAEVVVTHGGQNAVADVAAAGRPAVVVAADRPHAEQRATVSALEACGLAVGVDGWPTPERWLALLDRARELGAAAWRGWTSPDAVRDLAGVVRRVADRR